MVIQLKRNLRKLILQGHPWVYKEALQTHPKNQNKAGLAVLKDAKKNFLAWGIYDPHSPLAFRVLSLKDKKPQKQDLINLIKKATLKRRSVFSAQTNAFRLINGEGDLMPGLVCDVYNKHAVLQFDGRGPQEFWAASQNLEVLSKSLRSLLNEILSLNLESVLIKPRDDKKNLQLVWGQEAPANLEILENGVHFNVRIAEGQKTGFFLDQRNNRNYIKSIALQKSVLNLFSYTGGFSVYAGLGQAKDLVSVDISKGAISQAHKNWQLNGLSPSLHRGFAKDVIEFLTQSKEVCGKSLWDMIIVDPPSMTHSEQQKPQAIKKYTEVFSYAAKKLENDGDLVLSSCSSHINWDDFFAIIQASLSQARKRGQILRVSGQGEDHPFLHVSHDLRYLKFVHLCVYS